MTQAVEHIFVCPQHLFFICQQNPKMKWFDHKQFLCFQVDPGGSPDCGLCGVREHHPNWSQWELAAVLLISSLSLLMSTSSASSLNSTICWPGPMDTYHPRHMGSQSYKPARDARQSQFFSRYIWKHLENLKTDDVYSTSCSLFLCMINLSHAILISCCLPRWSPMSLNLSRMRQRTMQTSNTSSVLFGAILIL